jgi:hypothetical protein
MALEYAKERQKLCDTRICQNLPETIRLEYPKNYKKEGRREYSYIHGRTLHCQPGKNYLTEF